MLELEKVITGESKEERKTKSEVAFGVSSEHSGGQEVDKNALKCIEDDILRI